MKTQDNQQFHFGVYGICTRGVEVLVIKKSRGPYKGLYDLPGGRIEFNEDAETALRREFQEEVGVDITELTFINYNEYFCEFTNDNGEVKDFHHIGLYFSVTCNTEAIKSIPDGHDSLGALFVPISELSLQNCSQIALEMIQKVNK